MGKVRRSQWRDRGRFSRPSLFGVPPRRNTPELLKISPFETSREAQACDPCQYSAARTFGPLSSLCGEILFVKPRLKVNNSRGHEIQISLRISCHSSLPISRRGACGQKTRRCPYKLGLCGAWNEC